MQLNDDIQQKLRRLGKIDSNEILLKEGDLLVAVNVITQQRRIIEKDRELLEALSIKQNNSGRKILKG